MDWDFFFPTEGLPGAAADWGELCEDEARWPVLEPARWAARARALAGAAGQLPGTSGEERAFWDRVRLARGAPLWTAESNAAAATPRLAGRPWRSVWLYDAHHDAGYDPVPEILARGRLTCEDWLLAYALAPRPPAIEMRYPRWRRRAFLEEPPPAAAGVRRAFDDGRPPPVPFADVVLCRSGAWTPPWTDGAFEAFVARYPAGPRLALEPTPPRTAALAVVRHSLGR